MERQYAIGLDYGTLSVRGILLDMESGEEVGVESFDYPHGVVSHRLPDGTEIGQDYALAVPEDYLEGLGKVVKGLLKRCEVKPEQIKGIGLDVTSATVIPVDDKGTPVSMLPGFGNRPHSYIKLWKHHGAVKWSDRMEEAARERGEEWLPLSGGKIRCEMFIPKALETQAMDPEVYRKCGAFLEVGDWLTWYMTGVCTRSMSMAGGNSLYQRGSGYPSEEFFKAAFPDQEPVTRKFRGTMIPLGRRAGRLVREAAEAMGLLCGTPVASPMVDSHAAVVGAGADRAGDMTAVMGTSACYLMNSHTGEGIPGIYSSAYEAHIPEMFGYEGGQSCVGECLDWFVSNCVPSVCEREAEEKGISVHALLQNKVSGMEPEAWRLMALDWWNGVRSPLMRPELTGVITGLTIHTKPEEIYRALMEAVCFGAKGIVEAFCKGGHPVERLIATGGIPAKSPLLMQMLADICGMEVQVCRSKMASARGSAIMGAAVSDGTEQSARALKDWIRKLGSPAEVIYRPDYLRRGIYEARYGQYCRLADYFSSKPADYQEDKS